MGERVSIDAQQTIVMLYNKSKEKWEDKTSSISALFTAYQYGYYTGYDVYFKGNSKRYFYMDDNVRILSYIKSLSLDKHVVMIGDVVVDAIAVDLFDMGYCRVKTRSKTFVTNNLRLKSIKYKSIYNYYKELAAYAGSVTDDDEPLHFLSKNYERTEPDPNSVLFHYLDGDVRQYSDQKEIIVPFDFNQSQYNAIEEALTNSISVIEGPPGTGKTQTILNLVCNIVSRNMNCAVVSNNNTAIDNVYEKLSEEDIAFIAARLGRLDNVEKFFESADDSVIDQFAKRTFDPETAGTVAKIKADNAMIKHIQDLEVRLARLRVERDEVTVEQKNHGTETYPDIRIRETLPSVKYIELARRLEYPKKIRFIERFRIRLKYKVNLRRIDQVRLLDKLEALFYDKRIQEIDSQIEGIERELERNDKETVERRLKKSSRDVLLDHLQTHYKQIGTKEFTRTTFKHDYQSFLNRYPVVLSTSQSVLNNAPSDFLFDYLIIDEASQGDLLSSVIAMSCAKRVVVVGDSRQLQQIDEERLFEQSDLLAKKHDVPESYTYASNSVLSSILNSVKNAPVTMLKEHYRCAPDIINFCNKMFYDNALIPMTRNTEIHIEIIKTVPGNHGRRNPNGTGMYNQREIDVLKDALEGRDTSQIGIITPFRYQAEMIRSHLEKEDLEADTIHKFQGRQKDEIFLSFVVNDLEKIPGQEANRLHDFVTDNKLLNVAISRGRHKVTAIVSDKLYHTGNNIIRDFIKYTEHLYGNTVTKTSERTSVFDYLYAEYDVMLKKRFTIRPNEHVTERLMCDLIDKVLTRYKTIGYSMHVRLGKLITKTEGLSDEEKRYVMHPWTHVDYLFYNKVSKERLFVLEVDGIGFHEQSERQSEHDRIKDSVLVMNGLPVYRFKTNESNEELRLVEILQANTY